MNRYREAAQYGIEKKVVYKMLMSPRGVWIEDFAPPNGSRKFVTHEQIHTAPENPLITAIDELIKEVEG